MSQDTSKTINIKNAQSRSIPIDEPTFENLTGNELKVYMAIRFESDFSKRYSEVKISVSYISSKANVSERKVYQALNILEHEHFLLQRLNYQTFKRGQTNSFLVSRDYGYFKPLAQVKDTPAKNDTGVQNLTTPAENAVATAENAVATAKNDILIDQEYIQELSQTTTTEEQTPVVVNNSSSKTQKPLNELSDYEQDKLTKAYSENPVSQEFINNLEQFLSAALFSILNRDESITRRQRLHGIIKFVKNSVFDQPAPWAKEQKKIRDREIGNQKQKAIEEQMRNNAPKPKIVALPVNNEKVSTQATKSLLAALTGNENHKQELELEKKRQERVKKSIEKKLDKPNGFKRCRLPEELNAKSRPMQKNII